jgi:hypothetical protein
MPTRVIPHKPVLVPVQGVRGAKLSIRIRKTPLTHWGDVLHDHDLAEAIVDRALEKGRLIVVDGLSYRTRHPELDKGSEGKKDVARVSGKQRPLFLELTEEDGENRNGWVQDECHINWFIDLPEPPIRGARRKDSVFDTRVRPVPG